MATRAITALATIGKGSSTRDSTGGIRVADGAGGGSGGGGGGEGM